MMSTVNFFRQREIINVPAFYQLFNRRQWRFSKQLRPRVLDVTHVRRPRRTSSLGVPVAMEEHARKLFCVIRNNQAAFAKVNMLVESSGRLSSLIISAPPRRANKEPRNRLRNGKLFTHRARRSLSGEEIRGRLHECSCKLGRASDGASGTRDALMGKSAAGAK